MVKYINRSPTAIDPVEVIQWRGDNLEQIKEFISDAKEPFDYDFISISKILLLNTKRYIPYSTLTLRVSDMLIKDMEGALYKYKEYTFHKYFLLVE